MYEAVTLCPERKSDDFATFDDALAFANSKLHDPDFRSVRIYYIGHDEHSSHCARILAQAYKGDTHLR